MRKGLEKVMNLEAQKSGNYFYESKNNKVTVEVFYHSTCIAGYDRDRRIGFAENRGFNTTSTNMAVNGARFWLQQRGYKVVSVEEFKELTGADCRVGGWA